MTRFGAALAAVAFAAAIAVTLAPTASAASADVPSWAISKGSVVEYETARVAADGTETSTGKLRWEVVEVAGDLATFELSGEAAEDRGEAGQYVVNVETREIHVAPVATYLGLSFWLWIPPAEPGDTFRLWNANYEVLETNAKDAITLKATFPRADGTGSDSSVVVYHADARAHLGEVFTTASGAKATVTLATFSSGSLKTFDMVQRVVLYGMVAIEFAAFFILYRRFMKKLTPEALASAIAAATPAAFCASCGTPSEGGAFCAGCGAPAAAPTGGAAA